MDFLGLDLTELLPFIAAGFLAQLIDGALGMAFGAIANAMLVGPVGLSPANASFRVHLIKCVTTTVSALSHLASGNVDRRLLLRLVLPGVLGGLAGTFLLGSLDPGFVKPLVLVYLALLGLYLLVRGLRGEPERRVARVVGPLGLAGGFLDAIGGGGWGPVVGSNLMLQGTLPRKAVGSVNCAEAFVAVAISVGFMVQLGFEGLTGAAIGLMIGGVAAAPLGAVAARYLPARVMLTLVGAVLGITSIYGIWAAFMG